MEGCFDSSSISKSEAVGQPVAPTSLHSAVKAANASAGILFSFLPRAATTDFSSQSFSKMDGAS